MRTLLIILMVDMVFSANVCKAQNAEKEQLKQGSAKEPQRYILQHPVMQDSNMSDVVIKMAARVGEKIKTEKIDYIKMYRDINANLPPSFIRLDSGDRPDYSMAEYAAFLPDINASNYKTITTSKGNIRIQYQFCLQTVGRQDMNDPNSYRWYFLGPVQTTAWAYRGGEDANAMWGHITRESVYRIQIKVPLNGKDVREVIEIQQDSNAVLIYKVYKKTKDFSYLISNPVIIDVHDNWTGSWIYENQIYTVYYCPDESYSIEFESKEWDNFFKPTHL